ncbi:hypothetical protein ABZX40_26125 [Streptomyces sp. NPDC004610]|uniref:hypothetical protein n=1 Tax=unclassified Streptomyces TaxID=2593676 RepID=UPI0033B226E2
MRIRTTIATTALLLAALTACGGSDNGDSIAADPQPADAPTAADTQADAQAEAPKSLGLGDPAETIGDGGTGVLRITPDSVVFAEEAHGEPAANGVFVVIAWKAEATTGAAADSLAPITGGGWSWIAPDGEMIGWDSGNSTTVTLDRFQNSDPVQPGTYQWRNEVFDLTPEQAEGGTLLYVDGNEAAFRWDMPTTDTGPNITDLRSEVED